MMAFPSFLPSHHAGIGLRSPHYQEVIASPDLLSPWWEVHSENFFSEGGVSLVVLEKIRERYPVSFHGVGLSLGSSGPLSVPHLEKLATLVTRFEPFLVSEHLSWSASESVFANDLLPLPLTEEALQLVVLRMVQLQERLKRQVLLENPSTYVQFACSTIPEWEFMAEVSRQSGCGILLDINNIHVSATNHGYSSAAYIETIPRGMVQEMHLAGHSVEYSGGQPLLIDTHSACVSDEVWGLYRQALARFGSLPTLIEWDTEIPSLAVLQLEAEKANFLMAERWVA